MLRLLITGGLGNQLFQYYAARSQAKRLGVELEIDLQFSSENASRNIYALWVQTLPIRARIVRYPNRGPLTTHSAVQRAYRKFIRPMFWHRYTQPPFSQDPAFFQIRPRTIVSGYFESLFYVTPRDEEILSEMDLWKVSPLLAVEYAKLISNSNYISIHVRRGEWLNIDRYHVINYEKYTVSAMNYFKNKMNKPKFLVFSDDIAWCKQSGVFGVDCDFVEADKFGPNPAIDLLLMSACSHHIIANSTFSWWAAWMYDREDKITILPRHWFVGHTSDSLGLAHPRWVTL